MYGMLCGNLLCTKNLSSEFMNKNRFTDGDMAKEQLFVLACTVCISLAILISAFSLRSAKLTAFELAIIQRVAALEHELKSARLQHENATRVPLVTCSLPAATPLPTVTCPLPDASSLPSVLEKLGPDCTIGRPVGRGRVLVPFIYQRDLPVKLLDIVLAKVKRIPAENPLLNVTVLLDDRDAPPFNMTGKRYPWTTVAHVRNRILNEIDVGHYDYIAWLDADITEYSPAILTDLILGNPTGMSAPLVLITDKNEEFYDTCGFILNDVGKIPQISVPPPYFRDSKPNQCMSLAGVGAFFTVTTDAYRAGVRHDPHEPQYTDHYPISKWVRSHGGRIICNTGLRVYHANLPKWGLKWH